MLVWLSNMVLLEIEKIFRICPKLLINAEFYGLVLALRLKEGFHGIWEANLQPLGPNNKPKMLKVDPKFFWPGVLVSRGPKNFSLITIAKWPILIISMKYCNTIASNSVWACTYAQNIVPSERK
jgi:hypothetical protein